MTYEPRMKAGPLRNGAERGHGRIWHAVEGDPYSGRAALCGEQPRIMWSGWRPENAVVTCPRCIKKLADLPKAVGCTCDFSGGTRGMDRCSRCDGTGSRLLIAVEGQPRYFPNTESGHARAVAALTAGMGDGGKS